MSTRYNNGSHYENHQRAAELHEVAAHAHRSGEHDGHEEHMTAHELSQRALESSRDASHEKHADAGAETFGHREIELLAHELWQARGCPQGSSDEDWFHAVKELRSRAIGRR